MSEGNKISAKRSHQKNRFPFPDDIIIPESALKDRKFLTSYVRILNDSRVYKRRKLNGDRTSSRFEVDYDSLYNCIKVVYNEPVAKRKSILANNQSPQDKNPDDSGQRKSVSFLSKITYIDSTELDGVSSDWTDVDNDDSEKHSKPKTKSKLPKTVKAANNNKKEKAAPADTPSSKSKKKNKDKSSNKNGHKAKSCAKELFKFKITKPFRKFGRPKEKKLKLLQKKFGRRMFKSFVLIKQRNLKRIIPDKVAVPLEKITIKADVTVDADVTTPEQSASPIQEFVNGPMTKKAKLSITPPVQGNTGDTNEMVTSDTEIMESNLIESNASETVQNSSTTEDNIQSDNQVDSSGTKENSETNQKIVIDPSTEPSNSDQTDKVNGVSVNDCINAETNVSPDVVIEIVFPNCSALI